MKNSTRTTTTKGLLASLLLSFLCLNIAAQNPPKIYPFGDEFPLNLYAVSKQFADVSGKHWNNGHIYGYYLYIDSNGDTAISNTYVSNFIDDPQATPMPQTYFDTCKAYNMNAKGRLSFYENSTGHHPRQGDTTKNEIIQQAINTNLSWWDLPEEMRVNPFASTIFPDEIAILQGYSNKTRLHDPSQRPNYMYIAGHLFEDDLVHYVEDLDIISVSCYPGFRYINYKWPEPRGLPHSYIRWAIESTQKAITDPTFSHPNGFTIGKDYLNDEKTITAVLESFRNTRKVIVKDANGASPIINHLILGDDIDTLWVRNIEHTGNKPVVGEKILKVRDNLNNPTNPWDRNDITAPFIDVSALDWEIASVIDDYFITPEETNHDFWLALACGVHGIELYGHHYAVKGGSFYGHLYAAWNKLNTAVAVFKDNNLDKVQLNGIMDTSISYTILSGPDSTVSFRYEPTNSAYTDIQFESIKLQAKKWMGDTYIIAVNSTDSTVVYDFPVSTTSYNLSYENLITNQSRNWTEDVIHPPGYINTLHIIDTLPPLGVSVFKCKSSTTLDLSMRDCLNDNGYDAGYRQDLEHIDNSPDIWVRRDDDGFINQEHEAPKYTPTDTTNYVYVRVTNISSEPSSGNETLKVYWTKNGMHPTWPNVWDGSDPDPSMGNLISSQNIPVLQAGEEAILEFEWQIVKDTDTIAGTDWGHCLLARIENTNGKDEIQDYFNSNGDHSLSKEVFNNNNISLRNCEIIHNYVNAQFADSKHEVNKTLNLGNSSNLGDFYDITFKVPRFFRTSTLMDKIAVSVQFDVQGWNIFQNSIHTANLNISGERKITLTGFETTLEDVYLPANTQLPTTLTFDFLLQNDSTAEYEFLVSSKTSIADNNGDYWKSNVRYVVKNNPRDPFAADAGEDKEIDRGESTTLTAELIDEAAIYNWYDMEGNLIYTGKDLSISPEVSKKYHLEVIALSDGMKKYDAADVKVNPYFITNLSPNPASSTVIVDYFAEGASQPYIILVNTNTGDENMYPINPLVTQKSIQVSSYSPGIYTVKLLCDGMYFSGKNLTIY
jgi:hypothetical protein